jgi:hypothetical protein
VHLRGGDEGLRARRCLHLFRKILSVRHRLESFGGDKGLLSASELQPDAPALDRHGAEFPRPPALALSRSEKGEYAYKTTDSGQGR